MNAGDRLIAEADAHCRIIQLGSDYTPQSFLYRDIHGRRHRRPVMAGGARGNTEVKEVFRGQTINASGVTRFSNANGIPLGEGWIRTILQFNNTVVIGTGAGALADGALRIIKGITLRSDKNEFFANSAPGKELYLYSWIKRGTQPKLDTVTAASLTFRTVIEIWHVDPLQAIPEDTILDTRRYSALTLEISYGSLSDFYTAPGTATLATTMDMYIDRQRGPIPAKVRPRFYTEYGVRPPVDPNATLTVDLERASNMGYKRLVVRGSSAPIVGQPFSGVDSDTVFTDLTLDHDAGRPVDTSLYNIIQAMNKQLYTLEGSAAGTPSLMGSVVLDMMHDGSLQSALYSGNKSRLRVIGTLAAGAPNPAQFSIGYEAIRPLL